MRAELEQGDQLDEEVILPAGAKRRALEATLDGLDATPLGEPAKIVSPSCAGCGCVSRSRGFPPCTLYSDGWSFAAESRGACSASAAHASCGRASEESESSWSLKAPDPEEYADFEVAASGVALETGSSL
jgi:hypothetical protein